MSRDAPSARLRIVGLGKRFHAEGPAAVDDVHLDIAPGEFMTFLGPSGSGKTTTLNMIAGLQWATSGRIMIDDSDIAALPPYRRELGMVFQQYALFPHMTVRQNVAFPLKQRRMPRAELRRAVDAALATVRLGEYGDRLPAQLSGGQQQRVALARAFVFGPRALLMDEPLGALDKKLREQLQTEVARLHRELGVTILFVTHDQEEALALSDRIAVFNEGKVEQVGTPEDLYERPESRFVATFLGDSTIFDGVLENESGGPVLTGACFRLAVPSSDHAMRSGDRTVVNGPAGLVLRPERIRIQQEDMRPDGGDALAATVLDVVYQGAYRKISLEFDGGIVGSAREPVDVAVTARRGDRVWASWAPDTGVLIPGGGIATARSGVGPAAPTHPSADTLR